MNNTQPIGAPWSGSDAPTIPSLRDKMNVIRIKKVDDLKNTLPNILASDNQEGGKTRIVTERAFDYYDTLGLN